MPRFVRKSSPTRQFLDKLFAGVFSVPPLLLLYLLSLLLPWRWQLSVGAGVGHLLMWLIPSRRRAIAANLKLCYPDISDQQRDEIQRCNTEGTGIALFEMMRSFRGRSRGLFTFVGSSVETLQALLDSDRGVMLIFFHQMHLELYSFVFEELGLRQNRWPGEYLIGGFQRSPSNPLFNWLVWRCRRLYPMITHDNLNQMVRLLRAGRTIMYAYDRHISSDRGKFMEFMGQQVWITTLPIELLRITKAHLVVLTSVRQGLRYEICLEHIPDEQIPADNNEAMHGFNRRLEHMIACAPEQYLWAHRRFKRRPPGELKIY